MPDIEPDLTKISRDSWDLGVFRQNELRVDILRLDKIHSEISGNKWFKLKYYLEKAMHTNKSTMVSFGGAYSNHLLALAATAQMNGLRSIGFIRGEQPARLSHTLIAAKEFGMRLVFLPRIVFDQKKKSETLDNWVENFTDLNAETMRVSLLIPEGGAGNEGLQGAEEILSFVPQQEYTHVCIAVGTGTTMAGLINSALPDLKIIGISVLKGTRDLEPIDISWIKDRSKLGSVQMVHDYHFGGYAKYNTSLTGFMNKTYAESGIPTDFVYTGKLLFAVISMAEMKLFPPGSRILVLHTGGLQGNRSLTPGLIGF
ncbi:MAG TPA: 1-aminocyclopropane-1-carboxylate deaminase [Puia sp.]|nr:1-aminocyclopropane-1-carboxylate deaminase [Puia sp.]